MFITCEEDGKRVVYNLNDSVRIVSDNGEITAYKIKDDIICSGLKMTEMSIRGDKDLFYVNRWLFGMSDKNILDEKLRLKQKEVDGICVAQL